MTRFPLRLLAPLAGAMLLGTTAHGQDTHQHDHDAHEHDHGGHQQRHDGHQHDHDAHQHDHGQESAESDLAGLGLSAALTVEGIYHNRFSGDEGTPAGFGHGGGHDHGHDDHGHDHGLDEGFNLGHSEVMLQGEASLFEGQAIVSLTEDDISLEEAFLATRALPHDLRIKAGKFLSDIGYVNRRHPHAWDFIERPLVNAFLFGDHGLQETGVQLTWAPGDRVVVGGELFQGEGAGLTRFDEAGREARDSGPRLGTLFITYRPDLGEAQHLALGASAGMNEQYVRVDDHGQHAHSAEGDNWFAGLDVRFHHDAGRTAGHGDWQLGAEYFYTERDLQEHVQHHDQWHARDSYTERQDGAYVEAIYGIAPRWELGLRSEALGLTNEVMASHPTEIESEGTSWRQSGQVTWHLQDDIFLRAQASHEDVADQDDSWVAMLQFNATFGHHAGHAH